MISCARTAFLVMLAFAVAACGDTAAAGPDQNPDPNPEPPTEQPPEPLNLVASTPPIALGEIEAEFYEAVPYGPFAENLFDIYLPTADAPTPLLIFIHGGGFTGGSRDTAGLDELALGLLGQSVALASIDYRLLDSPDDEGVIKPLLDSTRAVQFIRYHASQLNVDASNVILMGGSAGAGTSLWIGFNDDMADPNADDPVLRQSTRVTAIIALATQATYDIGKWSTVVFEEFELDLLGLADALGLSQRLLDFYGITEIADFDSDEILAYRARVDMLNLMDANDPPIYVENGLEDAGPPFSINTAFHSANHGRELAERADEVGLEHVTYLPALGVADPSGEDAISFASRHFGL